MRNAPNRVLLAFKAWEDRKKEMEPVIGSGAADERTMRQLELNHLRQARHLLQDKARPDEQPFMVLLRNQIKRLEKMQHPNLLSRLFFRLKDRLLDGPLYRRQKERKRNANLQALTAQLKNNGFGYLSGKLENHLPAELHKVSLPLGLRMNDNKAVRFGLQFEKDPYGNFHLERLECSLYKDGLKTHTGNYDMREWPDMNGNQAINLLEGRAVKQDFTDALGNERQRWVVSGPDGLQQYDTSHKFDINELLEKMPAITANKVELTRYLEMGQLAGARWKQDQYYQDIFLQADPAGRNLKIFDKDQKPVTAEELNVRAKQTLARSKEQMTVVPQIRKKVRHGIR
ncbi:hypothetical protein [uncultured Mucilaginibacter sp.]|uniref:hypothetical protein n=1 Tax=uncultured Mucilaginibacter sp. TaxID=797541 RepID=UPI0025DE7701|nr:hypothetical protein [uncultured Mucilaginibacter sp.]